MKMKDVQCGRSAITGARFTIHPMTDWFVDIILSSLKETDTTKVWMKTDDVSTCVRGRSEHVFDVVKAIFLNASKGGDHVVLNATFSNGCPGDSAGDALMAEDSNLMNYELSQQISQETAAHFALYPLGIPGYMNVIMDQINTVADHGVFSGGVHYATRLDGDANTVFAAMESAFDGARKSDSSHIVMTVTMSANSPSRKEKQ